MQGLGNGHRHDLGHMHGIGYESIYDLGRNSDDDQSL